MVEFFTWSYVWTLIIVYCATAYKLMYDEILYKAHTHMNNHSMFCIVSRVGASLRQWKKMSKKRKIPELAKVLCLYYLVCSNIVEDIGHPTSPCC